MSISTAPWVKTERFTGAAGGPSTRRKTARTRATSSRGEKGLLR
ncbi:MAG: hypothetical protein QM820_49230 [Minicystis sp.]